MPIPPTTQHQHYTLPNAILLQLIVDSLASLGVTVQSTDVVLEGSGSAHVEINNTAGLFRVRTRYIAPPAVLRQLVVAHLAGLGVTVAPAAVAFDDTGAQADAAETSLG
jgi:hypothetical protein